MKLCTYSYSDEGSWIKGDFSKCSRARCSIPNWRKRFYSQFIVPLRTIAHKYVG